MSFPSLSIIKNIIFDLGGVIVNIDYKLTEEAFVHLGITDFNNIYNQLEQSNLFNAYEKGEISSNEFLKQLQGFTGNAVSIEDLQAAWNAMLLSVPVSRLEALKTLSNRFNMFVLSNTNAIHIQHFNTHILAKHNLPNLNSLFDEVYLSHEIGIRKPEPEAFKYILDTHHLSANETLFIDDSPQHIESARNLGLHVYQNPTNEDVFGFFN